MDYFIVIITTVLGLYFHWWLYVRIKSWADRDLALSFAEGNALKQAYMLEQLSCAKAQKIPRKDLPAWLEKASLNYQG